MSASVVRNRSPMPKPASTEDLRSELDNSAQSGLDNGAETQHLTLRSIVVGIAIGTLVTFSNCYFGLQTGWVSMMSLPSSLIAFATFKAFSSHLSTPFTPTENVLCQTISVAVGTMPLAAGLVGIIPAMEKLLTAEEGGPITFNVWQLMIWSAGVAFFGVFFAVPLRKQVIIKEKLPFPSGKATATMISVLHAQPSRSPNSPGFTEKSWGTKMKCLMYSFAASGIYTISTYFAPALRSLPVFDWITLYKFNLAEDWLWAFQPSLAYVGQGMIMGLPTTLSMLLGAIIGWGFLSPLSKSQGWAPGPVDDWVEGSKGWLLWVSLAIMLSDAMISLLVVIVRAFAAFTGRNNEPDPDAPPEELVSTNTIVIGLFGSSVLCIVAIKLVFGDIVPVYAIVAAILLALLLSVLGVRALGETDLNPVSGIGKISQLLFAFIVPRSNVNAVIINLVAGGVAEAGAQQAGDLMQDLKTGHLLGASPKAQFQGQMIGSAFSVVLSAVIYKLYMHVYEIPGPIFRVPTAEVWIDCSRLVMGHGLPPMVRPACILFAVIFGSISLIKATVRKPWTIYLPSGLAAAVGMYNLPEFTLARVVGGVLSWWWLRRCRERQDQKAEVLSIIMASGLVLGEGVFSILNLALAAAGCPHL
ncbi:OPT superfamily oligopeptide transporter [Saitoella complicata NRRL Y-17804]|uniref:OPT superfamily oligopeptide transporter n=1 Tax=Saitoella complicata (strain BCRC 22490 / CBS 7301 / JCM 7358 / NBRC 10748 / NRRL Y-17804) TaxID=698492 RepID=UPI000867273C|nr:OPT superfamily oligopeptide transporter [Saitoella complicata NRRL Y-17804]ODQ50021.1 OPT superfamily oligopeptide transporter [Saitoella complicata NRRL Y-17804]